MCDSPEQRQQCCGCVCCIICAVVVIGIVGAFMSQGGPDCGRANCMCKDGWHGDGKECDPCPVNSYCLDGQLHVCPSNTQSLSESKSETDCQCSHGFHRDGKKAGSCSLCPTNSFCPFAGKRYSCPLNSVSGLGSTNASACKCAAGFFGDAGEQTYAWTDKNGPCKGTEWVSALWGTITDGSGTDDYDNDMLCTWIITAAYGASIELTFEDFETELGFDYVYLFDCAGPDCTSFLSLSGNEGKRRTVTSKTGTLAVKFKTDARKTFGGFKASWVQLEAVGQQAVRDPVYSPSGFCSGATRVYSSRGTITDGSGSANYMSNMLCTWVIEASPGTRIRVRFDEFELEEGSDYVRLFACDIGESCASHSITGNEAAGDAYFTNSQWILRVEFVTDSEVNLGGFSATWSFLLPKCSGVTEMSGRHGKISIRSAQDDDMNNLHCAWVIPASSQTVVRLTFEYFELEPWYDAVRLYDCDGYHGCRLLQSLSGREGRWQTFKGAEGRDMRVEFKTDDRVTSDGFELSWDLESSANAENISDACLSKEVLSASRGRISLGSKRNKYLNGMRCTWEIISLPGTRIQLSFEGFELEATFDFVRLYACDSEEDCGPLSTLTGFAGQGRQFASYSGVMRVEFSSDTSGVAKGFDASWVQSPQRTVSNGTTTGLCSGMARFTEAQGTFGDGSGYSEYTDVMQCTWVITPLSRGGGGIAITFHEFHTEEGYDFVRLFDCDVEDSCQPFAILSGVDGLEKTFTAARETGVVRVEFESDEAVTAPGFSASWVQLATTPIRTSEIRGTFTDGSRNSAYENNLQSTWVIAVASALESFSPNAPRIEPTFDGDVQNSNAGDQIITLSFDSFETEEGFDFVYIFDCDLDDACSPRASLSGSAGQGRSYTSTTGLLRLLFVTNAAVEKPGWSASWVQEVAPAASDGSSALCSGLTRTSATHGTISDGSGSDDYVAGMQCTWVISALSGERIRLRVDWVEVSELHDYLWIFKCDVNETCGSWKLSRTMKVDTLESTTGVLRVEFRTDVRDGANRQGFQASWETVANLDTCTPCPANSFCSNGQRIACMEGALSPPQSKTAEACVCPEGSNAEPDAGCVVAAGYHRAVGGEIAPCQQGSYKEEAGDGKCILCNVPNSTTRSVASTSWDDCQCMDGYVGPREGPCVLCAADSYCPGGAVILLCPAHSTSPPGTSAPAGCICDKGFMPSLDGSCAVCASGFYCEDKGIGSPCPPQSWSPVGSKTITECVCLQGFFQDPGFGVYECSPASSVIFVASLDMTAAEFEQAYRETYRYSVAASCSVHVDRVRIRRVSPRTGGRRVLSESIDVETEVVVIRGREEAMQKIITTENLRAHTNEDVVMYVQIQHAPRALSGPVLFLLAIGVPGLVCCACAAICCGWLRSRRRARILPLKSDPPAEVDPELVSTLRIRPSALEVLDEELGTGANSVVRRGRLVRAGTSVDVAVKILLGLTREQERKRFEGELRSLVMASVSCHGVTKLFGTCYKPQLLGGERLCLVMELFPGSLSALLAQNPGGLQESQTAKYLLHLLRALLQLHHIGIVHRDLKPQNLLLSDRDELVVADFGIAKTLSDTLGAASRTSIAGTFQFMPPEAFETERFGGVTTKADIWSVGGCLFQMVTGQEPYQNCNFGQIMQQVTKGRPPEPMPLSSRFYPIFRRCFTCDPRKRPDAGSLLEDLSKLQQAECVVCNDGVAMTEGLSCAEEHFICSKCLADHIVNASKGGGCLVEEVMSEGGGVVSSPGQLPCPFFPRHCSDGELPERMVVNLLLGVGTTLAQAAGASAWNCFVAAKQRVGVERFRREEAAAKAAMKRQMEAAHNNAVRRAGLLVEAALTMGQAVLCPGCSNPKLKDDACIHMDCDCGVHFCYACGQDRYPGVVGAGLNYRPVNKRDCGCDRTSPYLQKQPGWDGFASQARNETPGHGALVEFHRRRMAWFVRAVKMSVEADVWRKLQQSRPGLLQDVIEGRSIAWEDVDHATLPQFAEGNPLPVAELQAKELCTR